MGMYFLIKLQVMHLGYWVAYEGTYMQTSTTGKCTTSGIYKQLGGNGFIFETDVNHWVGSSILCDVSNQKKVFESVPPNPAVPGSTFPDYTIDGLWKEMDSTRTAVLDNSMMLVISKLVYYVVLYHCLLL